VRESEIEKYLCQRVKAIGGEVRKIKWIGRRGAPDRLVLLPSTEPYFVEVKAPGKKLAAHQRREFKSLEKLNAMTKVIDSIDSVNWFLAGR